MSGEGGTGRDGDEAGFEDAATRLYALLPRDFVAARDAAAAQARAGGHPATARRITALRRPTQVAWVLNQLVREHRQELVDHFGPQPPMAPAWSRNDVHRRCARLVHLGHRIAERSPLRGLDERLARELAGALRLGTSYPQVREAIMGGRLERHPLAIVQAAEEAAEDAAAQEREVGPDTRRAVEEQRWLEEPGADRQPAGGGGLGGPVDELAARRRARARRDAQP